MEENIKIGRKEVVTSIWHDPQQLKSAESTKPSGIGTHSTVPLQLKVKGIPDTDQC